MQIVGRRVVLRDEIQETDYEDFFRWHNLEEWNYYDEPDAPFKAMTREAFESWRKRPKKTVSASHSWQIDTIDGKHVGWVDYYQLDEKAGCAYVGIDLPQPETWGQGFGTEAVRLVVDYLFRQMELQSVKTKTWTGNKRMRQVAEKVGFKEIVRSPHRAQFSIRGEPLEFVEYAIPKVEWLSDSNVNT
ncbi:MAG: GNAT family N-acetyltransferase [Chloroflexi bacterium]|nr:GNAT family N-acetyltransferase [Chloroflexota bacterium]